jgi:hypothetical protein
MWQTYRVGDRGKKHIEIISLGGKSIRWRVKYGKKPKLGVRISVKKRTIKQCLSLVEHWLEQHKAEALKAGPRFYIIAEKVACDLKLPTHQVKHCLHILNLKGLVSQKYRGFAHDTNRDPMFYGSESGWAANRYCVTDKFLKLVKTEAGDVS